MLQGQGPLSSLEPWLLSGDHSFPTSSPSAGEESQGSDLGKDLLPLTGLVGVGQGWDSWPLMLLRPVKKNTH